MERPHQCYREAVRQCSKVTLKSHFNVNCVHVLWLQKAKDFFLFRCISLASDITYAPLVLTLNPNSSLFFFNRVMR